MLDVVVEQVGSPEPCPYLPGLQAKIQYRVARSCRPSTYQDLLERGWRRFGHVFFRPACEGCGECRSLRVEVESFQPNRSMRRTLRRNRDLVAVLRRPKFSAEHLDLYHRYHRDQTERRDWPERDSSPEDYYQTFVAGYGDYGHELALLEGERLVAVALLDLLPQALSAVYCYYDPEQRKRSLGVLAILHQLALARSRGLPYVYLGFWIEGNQSMRYKSGYRPHQILQGRPGADREALWLPSGMADDDAG